MMKKVDVSVVLNMHREAVYLRPTLYSLDACARQAQQQGLVIELIAVFDRADEVTLDVFRSTPLTGFSSVKQIEIDVGSLGLARNAGIDVAQGEFIWTADGDDLVSSNSLVELVKTARNHPGRDVVVFIEFLAAFGESYHVGRYLGSEWYTAADFTFQHSFVSRVFLRKSTFDTERYLDLKLTTGFAYEDWDFNGRLLARGFEFLIAPETVFFYRQRGNSLLRQANSMSAKLIPSSPLCDPETFVSLMDSARSKHADWELFLRERGQWASRNATQELLASPAMVEHIAQAAVLDPEIQPARIETATSYCPIPSDPKHWGFQLENFFNLLGLRTGFQDVIILPWLKPGGAEKYILQIVNELHAANQGQGVLVLSGEAAAKHEWAAKLPPGSEFVDVYNAFPMFSDMQRDALVIRGLLAVAENGARLHVKASVFSTRLMEAYGSVLASVFKVVYYRFCDDVVSWRGRQFSSSWGVDFLRRKLAHIDVLVNDCRKISEVDEQVIGGVEKKCHTIYSLCEARATSVVPEVPTRRFLWASRVSSQKRPELVRVISAAVRGRFPDAIIDVYGQLDVGTCATALFDASGINYMGAFDGLETLPLEKYDGLIYTSAFDGLPNVILEALAVGLPVIAPDVGGIAEAVVCGETGFLVPNLLDATALGHAYADAVSAMYADWQATRRVADNGRRLIESRHGALAFREKVASVFLQEGPVGE